MSKYSPRISIGLPVFNGAKFLGDALDSILAQRFQNFELTISDNASLDETQDICIAYARRDSRIHYFRNECNRGAAWNFNRVFELSNAEYFMWFAHDDMCAPEYVERCVNVLDRDPSVVLCYSKVVIIDERGTHLYPYEELCNITSPRPHRRFRNVICNLGLSNPMFGVIRARTLGATPLLGNYIAADVVLLAEVALRGAFFEVPEDLFFRRQHSGKSERANPTRKQLAVWYDPANTGRIRLTKWRHFLEHRKSIRHVEMSWRERQFCSWEMARWLRWSWREMGRELIGASKEVLQSWGTASKIRMRCGDSGQGKRR